MRTLKVFIGACIFMLCSNVYARCGSIGIINAGHQDLLVTGTYDKNNEIIPFTIDSNVMQYNLDTTHKSEGSWGVSQCYKPHLSIATTDGNTLFSGVVIGGDMVLLNLTAGRYNPFKPYGIIIDGKKYKPLN
ncbi:MAG: hypothetical protein NXI01_00600 [Gammaproteobacteria bacterium]|nr:hypothetical protein [Gammaproteobacteria bacterium]